MCQGIVRRAQVRPQELLPLRRRGGVLGARVPCAERRYGHRSYYYFEDEEARFWARVHCAERRYGHRSYYYFKDEKARFWARVHRAERRYGHRSY